MNHTHTQKVFHAYLLAFALSLLFTIAAYCAVVSGTFTQEIIVPTIIALGIAQAAAQMLLFLHLGQEPKPRWGLHTFLLMLLVLIIVVFGSLWIIYSLNYRVMSGMS